ncbi:hypothetical protein ACFLRZ_01230 [Bacteroidota bacterium]
MENQILGIGSRVKHPQFGKGVVIQVSSESYEVTFIEYGTKRIMKTFEDLEIIEAAETPEDLVSYDKMEKRIIRILRYFSDIQETVDMARKWKGGKIVIEPGDPGMQGKEIPIDSFFHKIIMVRDRIRVMEQRINSSDLSNDDKVNLQQYITRIYGSLTTFNILFANKEDQFVGERTK